MYFESLVNCYLWMSSSFKSRSANMSTNSVAPLCRRATKSYCHSAHRDLRISRIYYILRTCNTEDRYFLQFYNLHLQWNIPVGGNYMLHTQRISLTIGILATSRCKHVTNFGSTSEVPCVLFRDTRGTQIFIFVNVGWLYLYLYSKLEKVETLYVLLWPICKEVRHYR